MARIPRTRNRALSSYRSSRKRPMAAAGKEGGQDKLCREIPSPPERNHVRRRPRTRSEGRLSSDLVFADAVALRTPLYDWHRAAGARFIEFGGWEMPLQYTGIVEEHL